MAIRISVSEEFKKLIQTRASEIGVTSMAEYIRILVNLDLATQNYQRLSYFTNKTAEEITKFHEQLDIYATPLQ